MAGALSSGRMNRLMTATPIAMDISGHPFRAAARVIEWHVVGMYAPGLVTGTLIRRFGTLAVIGAGLALFAASATIALHGVAVPHFLVALALLGVGWNFAYSGGTVLLTEAYRRLEKGKAPGLQRPDRLRDDDGVVVLVRRHGIHRRLGLDEPCRLSDPRADCGLDGVARVE